jgi:hypothetical protein
MKKYNPVVVSGSLAIAMLLSVLLSVNLIHCSSCSGN